MRKTIRMILSMGMLINASIAVSEPTRTFALETTAIAPDKQFSIDLINSISRSRQIRFGAFDGEIILSEARAVTINGTRYNNCSLICGSSTGNTSIGFKIPLTPNVIDFNAEEMSLAAFAMLGLDTQWDANSDFLFNTNNDALVGLAFGYIANFVFVTANSTLGIENNNATITLSGSAYLNLEEIEGIGHLKPGVELYFSNRDQTNIGIALGTRWMPTEKIAIDLLFMVDPESKGFNFSINTPGAIRANIQF